MEEDIPWTTKRRARARKLGILILDACLVGTGGDSESANQTSAKIQEHTSRTSFDLRCDIIDLRGAENLPELKQIKNKAAACKDLMDVPVVRETYLPFEYHQQRFFESSSQGKPEVEKSLEDGGDPNTWDQVKITGADINFKDRLDSTAVHWACRGGSIAAPKVLQDRGADINVKDKLLSSPLHVATRTGHSDMVQHLLASEIDINAKDREGDTALHDAVRLNRFKIVKVLIVAGANMQIKNAETLERLEQMREVGLVGQTHEDSFGFIKT
ncbi:putative ankyrin repeat domain-containing protein 2-like [Triplophysa rosa]|uniref:Ankyrin repeat domain-containing protein 2-like n=1 Tax=Triplophysa rosa TaxID=992332 RepID=A0A9W7WP45_TRIRA|nr:putative ankyrin repeat domain-containing protein 2-like [Triplophysa rosa]